MILFIRIERIVPMDDGTYIKADVPKELPGGEIVILQPIGNLFFAGTAEFEDDLPDTGEAHKVCAQNCEH